MKADAISAVILAGGRGRRMGYRDKGLLEIDGRPLAGHVIDTIAPRVGAIAINANRNQAAYQRLGHPLVDDARPGYPGPLAGIEAGLAWSPTPYLLVVPCDTPYFDATCIERLGASLAGADLAVAHDGTRLQPLHALIRRHCLASLRDFLDGGGRRVDQWLSRLDWRAADCRGQAAGFRNINVPEALHD